jgi:hypothetical protein
MIYFKDYLKLFEGGNVFDDTISFDGSYVSLITEKVSTMLEDKLGFSKSDYSFVGSLKNKKEGIDINDVDVVVSCKSDLISVDISSMEDSYKALEKLSKLCSKHRIKNEVKKTLGLVSCKVEIEDKKYLQVDLLVVPNLVWGKWSYYSPGYDESKYKGLYRNALLEAIAKSIHFEIEEYKESEETDYFKKGDVKSYYRYRYLRNLGLWKVKEYNDGVRVFKYKKDYDTYSMVSYSPNNIIKILLGDIDMEKTYTFEDVYAHITKKSYKHYDLLDIILENFRIVIVDRQKNALPSEVDYLKSNNK